MFERTVFNLRLALRKLRGSPGYALVVVSTLALGVAASTTVFSLMSPYLMRPLPYQEANRLVHLGQVDPVTGWDGVRFSHPQIVDFAAATRSLEALSGYYYGSVNLTGAEGPERVKTGYLMGNAFELLGSTPHIGRAFGAAEDDLAAPPVVVLDHGLWQRRFGGERSVLGRSIDLDGVAHTVIGVMPPRFVFPFNGVRMWVPMRADPAVEARDHKGTLVFGRLADGWSREQAQEELTGIQAALGEQHPEVEGRLGGVVVQPLRQALNFAWDILSVSFIVLLGAVVFLLLIACVNVASLSLASAIGRGREIAVRSALGAGRKRIVGQLMAENVLLAVAGGLLGVLLAEVAVSLVAPLLPEDLYRVGDPSVDGRVLLFSLLVTLSTPVLFGLAPALAAAKTDLAGALKDGSQAAGAGTRTLRVRRGLVVAQVALAIVLLTGTGLMVRSFQEVQQSDLGFAAPQLLTVEVEPSESSYPEAVSVDGYYQRLRTEAVALPGIEAAAQVNPLPMNHEVYTRQVARPGFEPATAEEWPVAVYAQVSDGYFQTMGIPLVSGSAFDGTEQPDGPAVAVVNRSLAGKLWPQGDPVGASLLVGDPSEPTAVTVVGVVGDIEEEGFGAQGSFGHQLYLPMSQASPRRRFLVLRTAAEPVASAGAVRDLLRRLDPNLPAEVRPMSAVVLENTLQWSASAVFLGVFGLIALGLAGLGLYGLISYSVSERRAEIGIRLAIGADRRAVSRQVVSEALRLTGLGAAIGLVLALVVAKLIASLLFGVSPFDLVTLAGVVGIFGLIAVASSLVPAVKASRVDPLLALRSQ